MPFPLDLQIGLAARLKPLADVAGAMGTCSSLMVTRSPRSSWPLSTSWPTGHGRSTYSCPLLKARLAGSLPPGPSSAQITKLPPAPEPLPCVATWAAAECVTDVDIAECHGKCHHRHGGVDRGEPGALVGIIAEGAGFIGGEVGLRPRLPRPQPKVEPTIDSQAAMNVDGVGDQGLAAIRSGVAGQVRALVSRWPCRFRPPRRPRTRRPRARRRPTR
jgi:hypothetical protein